MATVMQRGIFLSLGLSIYLLILPGFSTAATIINRYVANAGGNSYTANTNSRLFLSVGESGVGQMADSNYVIHFGFIISNPTPAATTTITPTHGPTFTPTPTPTTSTPPLTPMPNFKGQIIEPLYFFVYPSPCHSVFVPFRFFLKQSADVNVTVCTLMGRKVWSHQGDYPQGWSEFVWNSTGVANGGYVFIVEASSGGVRETLRKRFGMVR